MKKKFILFGSLGLLLAVILFMAWDMFLKNPDTGTNPYDYNMKSLKQADTALFMYAEVQQLTAGKAPMHGIAVDRSDRIYICGEGRVEIFDPAGRWVNEFNITGASNCIHVGMDGLIYLGMQDHVEIYDPAGKQVKKWNPCGEDAIITSIVTTGNEVYIADAGNKVAYRYDLSGNLLKKIGEKDPARGIPGFVVPSPYFDLVTAGDSMLWVVNPGHHSLEHYNHEGDLISSWGESSMSMEGFCGCCNPSNIAMFTDGSFVTTEKGIERIKVYFPNGTFKGVVAGPGSFIEGTRGLDVAIDSKNRIIVLDPAKKQVRIFVLKNEKS